VLIGPTGEIKISDFGLSRIMKNMTSTNSSFIDGTMWYNSPELFNYDLNKGPVTTLSSDVWAFGIVAHQVGLCQTMLSPGSNMLLSLRST
jgi:serine/threonine protein kinase